MYPRGVLHAKKIKRTTTSSMLQPSCRARHRKICLSAFARVIVIDSIINEEGHTRQSLPALARTFLLTPSLALAPYAKQKSVKGLWRRQQRDEKLCEHASVIGGFRTEFTFLFLRRYPG